MLLHFAAVLYLVGSVRSQTICSAPESVSQLKVIGTSTSSVAVQWEPPSDTDCLEEYRVCWSLADGNQSNCVTQARNENTTTDITGLDPCTSYVVNVTSVGSFGDYSETVNITTWSDPEKVSRITQYSATVSNITVQWRIPTHTQCLQDIQVCWSLEDGTQSECATQSYHGHASRTIDVANPCTKYNLNASSVSLTGVLSEATHATILSGPEQVSNLQVKNISDSTMTVMWELPNITECLKSSKVCWSQEDGTRSNCTEKTKQGFTNQTVTGLDPCTNYTINATLGGTGNAFSEAVSTTMMSASGKVTGLRVTSSSSSNITVEWGPPENAECLQGYRFCWSYPDGNQSECHNIEEQGNMTRDLTELTACGSYSITVNTFSEPDKLSDPVNIPAVAGSPLGTVNNLRAVKDSSNSIRVDWDPITEDTECLDGYSVCWGIEGSSKMNCTLQSLDLNTSVVLGHLVSCTTYTATVSVQGLSEQGETVTTSAIINQAPSKVSSLETRSVGLTVFVTWTPPSQLSWCVAQYEICWGSSPDDQNCSVQANNVTTFNITELTPCGEYVVGVRALGQPDNSSQVNTTVTAAPEPARNLNFPFINTTFIEADWEAPDDQSDCIDYYQVCMTVSGETACVNQTRDITTTSYPELRPCTSLTVDVTAWTEGAHSSVMSEQVNTRDEVPDVPTHLHVNYAEVDKVNLEWHAPVANPECVEWYEVCWKGGQIESCNNATDIQDLITGLAPCGVYSANVTAVGAAGRSATSHLVVHTRNTAFNEIYILEVKSSNSTTLEVEWKAPFKNSECVQEYEVCWLGQETGGKGCMIQTMATTKATITGLISCVNYTINVTAKGVMKNSTAVSMPVMTNSTLIQGLCYC